MKQEKKYIDADLLRKDIEFAKSVYSNPKRVVHGVADAFRQDGRAAMCDDILKKLDSLPEQPVEGLEKEIDDYIEGCLGGLEGQEIASCARYFYELGCRHTAEMYDNIEHERQRAEEAEFPTTDEEVEKALASTQKVELPDKYKTPDWLFKKMKQPVEWEDEYREEDLRTRFAFYTYKNEEDDSVLYLSNVFVEEASRNAGFGTKILEAAEKVAETIGAITIRLKVKQDSPANAWYRKRGYGYIAFEGEYDWLEKNLEYLKPKRNGQPVDGLEEEIDRYWKEEMPVVTESDLNDIARHFAKWGAEQKAIEIFKKQNCCGCGT